MKDTTTLTGVGVNSFLKLLRSIFLTDVDRIDMEADFLLKLLAVKHIAKVALVIAVCSLAVALLTFFDHPSHGCHETYRNKTAPELNDIAPNSPELLRNSK